MTQPPSALTYSARQELRAAVDVARRRKLTERKCLACRGVYTGGPPSKRYCSLVCQARHRRERDLAEAGR